MIRDYNKEIKDKDTKYAYNFDFDIMHPFMMESFKEFLINGSVLELGSFKGAFTKHILEKFSNITCIEASEEAVNIATTKFKEEISKNTIKIIKSRFEEVDLHHKYDNIIITHVLEHLDNPVNILKRINNEWLENEGNVFIVCPNANAASRQIAVKMGVVPYNSAITKTEEEHGHRITYTFDTLEKDVKESGLKIIHRSGIFFKALSNFQWDQLLETSIISKEYLKGCYELGMKYPDLCSSILLICKKNN